MKIFFKTSAGAMMLALALFACQSPKPDFESIVNDFADLECRAIELRKQRYQLADEMRFADDTMIADTSSEETKARLKEKLMRLDAGKDGMVNHGLALADTIQKELAALIEGPLKNVDDRREFDHLLEEELHKRGCIDTKEH